MLGRVEGSPQDAAGGKGGRRMDALFLVGRPARQQHMRVEDRLALRREHAEACAEESRRECAALSKIVLPKSALGQAAAAQASRQSASEPVQRFLDLLNAALAAGKAHVAGENGKQPVRPEGWGWRRQGDGWQPRGDRVGWLLKGDLHLAPEAACPQLHAHGVVAPREVGHRAHIVAMQPHGVGGAEWADGVQLRGGHRELIQGQGACCPKYAQARHGREGCAWQ